MRNAAQQRLFLLLVTLTVAATACAGANASDPGPGKRVQMTLAKDAYRSGDTVTATVRNISEVTLDYANAFCHRALQQYQGGKWSTVSPPPDACTLQIAILGPGQAVPLTYRLANVLQAGLYRLAIPSPTPLNAQMPEPDVTTPPFSVNSVTLSQS